MVQQRGCDGRQAEGPHGGVQGPGRPGRPQGGSHGQRVGRAVRRPSDAHPRLEEAALGRGRGGLQQPGPGGLGGRRGPPGRAVRADRTAQDGAGVAQKKKLPSSHEHKRSLIDGGHPALSVRRQCELLGLNRSSLYYEPVGETSEDLRLMRLIDEQYTACPFYGSRRMTAWLVEQGEEVNRKRVQRLMRTMGLEAIYPK